LTETGPVFSAPQACTYCTQCEALCPAAAVTCEFEIIWREK
jgi:NAD-dependent dihydropyrimidine dehydrogenase PreA subunit